MSAPGQGPAPRANWYPDSQDPRLLRYWTGTEWTELTKPMAPATPPPVQYSPARKAGGIGWVIPVAIVGGLLLLAILAAVAIPVFLNQREKAAEASGTSGETADETAGVDPSVGAAADTAVRVDASTLAKELAVWYVDNDGPPPAIGVSDGQYVVAGHAVGDVSPGVVLGGVTGTGDLDWCVWLSNPDGDQKVFQFSAERGIANGPC